MVTKEQLDMSAVLLAETFPSGFFGYKVNRTGRINDLAVAFRIAANACGSSVIGDCLDWAYDRYLAIKESKEKR